MMGLENEVATAGGLAYGGPPNTLQVADDLPWSIMSNRVRSGSRKSGTISPIILIDSEATIPLNKQIYHGYRMAILRGHLRPGQAVPSSRELASEIQVSRFPVLHAYAQLSAEGYFETRRGTGTFVSVSLPEQLMSVEPQLPTAIVPSGLRPLARRSLLIPPFEGPALRRGWGAFGVYQPAFDQFPYEVWSSLVTRHSRNPSADALHHIDPLGSERFREAVCYYLRTARAVQCKPNQIMIVSGSQQALDITARVLLDPDSRVFVEEPGCQLQRTVLTAAGAHLLPVPVDGDGMDVASAIVRYGHARAAVVTPSHQYPLGSTMSASRRLQLLNWAQNSGAWIIEDDYDSEYRFESRPIASLQGLDVNARVIYIGTFSKVLFPSLRIGYIVIPPDLVERFTAMRAAMDIFPPYLYQEVLADFMSLGHFARHIRSMRQLYAQRRKVLIQSLQQELGQMLEFHGAEAGMHVTITLPAGQNDVEITAKAAADRLWVTPLSPSYSGEKVRHGLILGFGSTPAEQIHRAVCRLRALLVS
jgi:GntR family transcriptional regulator/MocR family aminotransferase